MIEMVNIIFLDYLISFAEILFVKQKYEDF